DRARGLRRRRLVRHVLRAGRPHPRPPHQARGCLMTMVLAAVAAAAALAAAPKEKATLKGHERPVHFLAFDKDGALVSASWDRTVRRWDLGKGKPTTLTPTVGRTSQLGLSADGAVLATGDDKGAEVWDVKTGKRTASFGLKGDGGTTLALSPDGKTLALAQRGANPSILLMEVATGKEKLELKGHDSTINSVAFSGDGRSLVSAGSDGAARVWDLKTGKAVATLTPEDSGSLGV